MTYRYRPHKGNLLEALNASVELETPEDLINHLTEELSEFDHGLEINEETIKVHYYKAGEMHSDYIVVLEGYGVMGFISRPEPEDLTVPHPIVQKDRPQYELVTHAYTREKGIKCLRCGLTSWNSNDVEHRYCGFCNMFHSDWPALQTRRINNV